MGTLSYSYGKPRGYDWQPGTCRWCGDRLSMRAGQRRGGYRDTGKFCSLRCGYQWAVWFLEGERA